MVKEKAKLKRKGRKQKGKAKKAKKTTKLTHHLKPCSTASGTAIVYLMTEILDNRNTLLTCIIFCCSLDAASKRPEMFSEMEEAEEVLSNVDSDSSYHPNNIHT